MTFAGFPSRPQSTAIPNVFFSDVLPQIGDPVTLGVVLYALHLLSRKKGFPRYITAADMLAEPAAVTYLGRLGVEDPDHAIREGLAQAAKLNVLVALTTIAARATAEVYFLNAPADRRALESVRSGDIAIGRVVVHPAVVRERSSVFALYESLIGTVSPLISDELAEAQRLYPAEWLDEAFAEAAAQNARSWRYISRILERWAREGRHHAKTERSTDTRDRYFRGKYGEILRDRLKP